MNRGEERRDSFEAERGEQWGEQCGWMGAKRWQIGGILYTDNVRERLSYHLRHNRQWESITLSLLVCCLRTCFPCWDSPHSSFWLRRLGSPHFHLTSTFSSLPPILSPPLSFPFHPLLFSSLLLCPLISRTFFSFLGFSASQLHFLSPLKLHLHCSPLLPLCLLSFYRRSSLSEWASWQAVWSRGSWAWLNCSKIAASLRRLHYLSSAAPHRVCETHSVYVCVGGEGGSVRQDWVCARSCAHINQTCCHQ